MSLEVRKGSLDSFFIVGADEALALRGCVGRAFDSE
jgi:hypothetical protein